jgi:hypothetical protein
MLESFDLLFLILAFFRAAFRGGSLFLCYTFCMKIHFWNTVALVFFVGFVLCGYAWLDARNLFPAYIPTIDLFLIALATMRLVRLFTYDAITAFIRNWFVDAEPDTFRGTLSTLIHCPWCTGLWFSALTVFAYFASPVAWYLIVIFALSAVATFLQLLANLIGWNAELRKKETQSLPR